MWLFLLRPRSVHRITCYYRCLLAALTLDIFLPRCLHSWDYVHNQVELSKQSAALILWSWTNRPRHFLGRGGEISKSLLLRWKNWPKQRSETFVIPSSRWQKHALDLWVRCFQWFLPALFLHIINSSLCSLIPQADEFFSPPCQKIQLVLAYWTSSRLLLTILCVRQRTPWKSTEFK